MPAPKKFAASEIEPARFRPRLNLREDESKPMPFEGPKHVCLSEPDRLSRRSIPKSLRGVDGLLLVHLSGGQGAALLEPLSGDRSADAGRPSEGLQGVRLLECRNDSVYLDLTPQ